jgi:hypothetical protein
MKKLVWFLGTVGFVAPLSVLMVRQMSTQQMIEDALTIVTNSMPRVYTPWYVVISSLLFGLLAGTKTGRRTGRKMSRGLLHLACQFFYMNTRVRLGRFMALLWLFGWLGIALTGWQAVWGSWTALLLMFGYWGIILCAFYLHDRYDKWKFLKFRLPGRIRWLGIGEELKAAGGRLARFYRRGGRSRG